VTTRIDARFAELKQQGRSIRHLSPAGRGRLRSSRVRGLADQSNRRWLSIISRTPWRFSYTSVLETRTTKKPQASRTSDRILSCATAAGSECVTPSTSTTSLPSSDTKSTTYRSIGCWRRNFHRASRRLRRACHNLDSALVCEARRVRALALNLSVPLTRIADAIRPLPNGERYSTTFAAP